MAQPYDRVFNFSAGPATLPVPVLEQVRDQTLNWNGSGMSVLEMSHRSKAFETIIGEAEADLRTLLAIPQGYKVLFLQGGASLQFSMIPMNFLPQGAFAEYVLTGSWGKKAIEAAKLVGDARVLFDAKSSNYNRVPAPGELKSSEGAAYVHTTLNETIQGVDYGYDVEVDAPLVCDASSTICSRPIDVGKYSMIYAGAQKNLGPAGVTVVILRDEMLQRIPSGLAPMLDYKLQAENASLYNTPPCVAIWVCGLCFKHLLGMGGLGAVAKNNQHKAGLIYAAIDGSGGFYKGHAESGARSLMNIAFTLPSDELTSEFLAEAKKNAMYELKGHRSVGGCRASVYNAFPVEGCQALAAFMGDFAQRKA